MLKKMPQSPNTSMMTKDSCQDKFSLCASGAAGFSKKSELPDSPSSKDIYIDNNLQNLLLPHTHSRNSNKFFSRGDSKDLEEHSSSQNQAEPFECTIEQVGSALLEPVTKTGDNGQKSPALDSSSILLNNEETPLQSQTEGSDIVEDDVKVCDICGDTGREEMLAICSRCSDGAEHTYCMRIMLDKVPEGDWLCEECQMKEDAEKQKLDRTKTIAATPKEPAMKENILGGISNPKLLPKLDRRAEEAEMNKASKVSLSSLSSSRRHADSLEDSSKSRKLAIDAVPGPPGIGNPGKKPALSRESSLKTMDVCKSKQANPVPSSGSQSANNSKDIDRIFSRSVSNPDSSVAEAQLQSPRGTTLLSRSATVNSLNSKPKVKQLLDDAFQKQILTRESSRDVTRKEGLITKSKSFRMPSSGRSSMLELKAKMVSSNISRAEEPRALKQSKSKEQNVIERKSSFKLERHAVSSLPATGTNMPLPKANLKGALRGESVSPVTSMNNSYQPSAKQRDEKLSSSNSTVSFMHKGSEDTLVSDGCGDMKKQPSSVSSRFGSKFKPTTTERKPCQVGSKDDTTANSCIADESCDSPDIVCQDGPRQSHESRNQDGKKKDSSSFSSYKQVTSPIGKNTQCSRCNELGHRAKFCPVPLSVLKAPPSRCSGEMINKNSRWKDAVEAISRTRHMDIRLPDQSADLSTSSTVLNEVALKDQLSSSSSCLRNSPLQERTFDSQEALRSSMADSSRTTVISNVKRHSVHLTETASAPSEAKINGISDEVKTKQMSSQAYLTAYSLRISAIPEHDYVWQGGFVLRSGKFTDYFGGIQAHVSTCASRRVLEVVSKFPSKVLLEEVPRLSSWPTQFQGKAKEDNIALYFFAKDHESYEKNYKRLLDNMLKNDLALKGNVDGIELLIFPSNQLLEKSQRWNRLFFLWAMFRERKVSCSESLYGSQKRLYGAHVDLESSVLAHVMAEPDTYQKTCSYGQKEKELSSSLPKPPEAVNSTTVDFPFSPSSKRGDENHFVKTLVLHQKPIDFHEHNNAAIADTHSYEKQASCSVPEIHSSASGSQLTSLHDGSSLSSISMTSEQLCPEMKGDITSLKEGYRDSKSKYNTQLQPAAVQNGLGNGELVTLDSNTSNRIQAGLSSGVADSQDTSSLSSKTFPVSLSSLAEARAGERLMDNITCIDAERKEGPIEKEQNIWESRSSRKRPHTNFQERISETSCELSSESFQTMPWKDRTCLQVDGENSCKKIRIHNYVNIQSSSHEQIFGDRSSKILGVDSDLLNKEQKGAYASDSTTDLENLRTTERYLFPVDSGHVRDLKSGNAIPLHILSSDEEDLPETDVPDLELALGAEKKRSNQGVSPLFGQIVDEKNKRIKLFDPATASDNEDLSASLSLSLSFPFSTKEQNTRSVTKTEQLLPKRHQVNTSLLLSGGFTET